VGSTVIISSLCAHIELYQTLRTKNKEVVVFYFESSAPAIARNDPRKPRKNLCDDNRALGPELNLKPLECEAELQSWRCEHVH